MHSTDDLNDSYLGSGLRLRRSVKKYGAHQHYREILEHLTTRKEASDREKELITAEIRLDPKCLNCGPGGLGAVDLPATTEETRAKLSASGKLHAVRKFKILNAELEEQIANFTMSREEVLATLIQLDGKLSKNATRALIKLQANKLAGQDGRKVLAKRERLVQAKWNYILTQLQNPKFKDNLVEQIDAYVFEREARPVCKMCSKQVTFFRFGERYGIYCGSRCQLLDPQYKNPVLTRWATHQNKVN